MDTDNSAPQSATSAELLFRSITSSRKLRPSQEKSVVAKIIQTAAIKVRRRTSPILERISLAPQRCSAAAMDNKLTATQRLKAQCVLPLILTHARPCTGPCL